MFKKIYIVFSFFIPFISLIASYPWPLSPFNSPHPVVGTLGEYRTGHLHEGVDMDGNIGTSVYPVMDGIVKNVRNMNTDIECVEVTGDDGNNYEYIHIDALARVNDTVVAGTTVLGTIKEIDDPHLHFEVNNGMVNPLNGAGITPYSDGADPKVWGGDTFMFYKQASSEKLSSPLWGKVDILVRAKDIQDPPGSENVSVYRIGYNIAHNISASQVLTRQGYGYHENIRFDHASGEVNCIYDKTQSDNSTYYYWVTNALGLTDCNRYWNTKLKAGEEWNGTEAKINTEAMYPDEEYEIAVVAYDIKGNKAENSKVISLDNYVPFADRVTVYKDTDIKYDGKWDLSGNEMHLNIPTDDSLSIGDEIKLTISFSEKMNSQVEVKLKKDSDELSVDGDWFGASNALWVGNVTIPDEEEAEGEWTIMISSKDLADHTLDIDPSSIGKRDNNGQWRNYNSNNAWDKNHKIHVGEPPPPRVVYSVPSDNAQEVPVYKDTLTIIFSKTMEQNVTQDAVSIVSDDGEDISFNPSWKDTITLQIFPSDTLDYCMEYICTISDEAMSEDSVILDGNTDSDGKPGGAHIFTFTTEPPDVILYLSPFIAHVEEGNPLNATLYTIADSLKKEVECNIDFNAYSPGGWLVSELSEPSFLLFPDSIHKDKFTIRNGGTTFPLLLSPKIPFKCDEISCLGFYWSAQGHINPPIANGLQQRFN